MSSARVRTARRLPENRDTVAGTGNGAHHTSCLSFAIVSLEVEEVNCTECEEPITNPLCPLCVHEGVRQWLLEHNERTLAERAWRIASGLDAHGDVSCLRCACSMRVCVYCVTKELFHLIARKPALIGEYLVLFNFDLEHQGWERDARAYLDQG